MDAITIKTGSLQAQNIGDLYNNWLQFIEGTEATANTYTKAVRIFIKYLQKRQITQPTREDVKAYREELKAEGKKPTTVQLYLMAVKQLFKWTDEEGLYPNIAKNVKTGVKLDTEHKKDYLTTKQVKTLLGSIDQDTAQGRRDIAIISLMLTTGLRTIEVVRANVGDLKPVGDYTALFIQGKGHTEKSQYVKIPAQVEEAIRDHLADRDNIDSQQPLFCSLAHRNKGERLTTKSISRLVKDHLVAVGLESERLTAHSLRHTTATLNLLNGGTVEETQQLLRHTNINTTLIYSHALERANNNSEMRVAGAIFS